MRVDIPPLMAAEYTYSSIFIYYTINYLIFAK
jgi:hypothetical protein